MGTQQLASGIVILLSLNLFMEYQAAPMKKTKKTQKSKIIEIRKPYVNSFRHFNFHKSRKDYGKDTQLWFRKGHLRRRANFGMSKPYGRRSLLYGPWFHEWVPCDSGFGDWFGPPYPPCDCTGGQYEYPGCDCTGGLYEYPGCDCTGGQFGNPGCCCCEPPGVYPLNPCCCCGGRANTGQNNKPASDQAFRAAKSTPGPVLTTRSNAFDMTERKKKQPKG